MTVVYVAALVLGVVGGKVLVVAGKSAAAEHRDHDSPSLHHMSRLFWWSFLFGFIAIICVALIPTAAPW